MVASDLTVQILALDRVDGETGLVKSNPRSWDKAWWLLFINLESDYFKIQQQTALSQLFGVGYTNPVLPFRSI